MNWFLVIVAIVVSVVAVACSWKLLYMFLDEDEERRLTKDGHCRLWPFFVKDDNGNWTCNVDVDQQGLVSWTLKWVCVLSLCFATWISLLLPFDVANRRDPTVRSSVGGGLDVAFMWMMTLWGVCLMTVVVLPFCFWFYESWDPTAGDEPSTSLDEPEDAGGWWSCCKQCSGGSCWTCMSIFVFFGIVLVLYFGLGGNAEMEYAALTCPGIDVALEPCIAGSVCREDFSVDQMAGFQAGCTGKDDVLLLQVSFFVYTVALLTALGWVLFVVFAGVGLFYLPVDLYHSWYENKLKAWEKGKVDAERQIITQRSTALGKMLKSWEKELKNNKGVHIKKIIAIQYLIDKTQTRHNRNESYRKESAVAWMSSPFVMYGRMLLFFWAAIWSFLWFLHMIMYNATQAHPLLNDAFIALDGAFSLLGILFYSSFSFYLLWATINGCTHIGLVILCMRIHPLVPGETLLSSFLFNCILILYAAVACVSFCAMSFREYAANTVVDTLYGSYINKVQGIRYIMEYFQYGLFFFFTMTMLWWMCGCIKAPKVDDGCDSPTALAHIETINKNATDKIVALKSANT